MDWWLAGLGQIMYGDGFDSPRTALFMNGLSGWDYYPAGTAIRYAIADRLPAAWGVTIRRSGTGTTRDTFGHFAMNGVSQDFVDNDRLTDVGMTTYQNLADSMPLSIVHDGVTLIPVTTSYKMATMTDVTKLTVRPRLGVLHRRCHFRPDTGFINYPKEPPI